MPKILIVEDDVALAHNIANLLTFEKYSVDVVHSSADADSQLKTWPYDALVLDVNLPGASGIEVLKNYRNNQGKAPVLLLTGRQALIDKTIGFEAGCDDYLTKPFHMKELSVRLQALLRRPLNIQPDVITAGQIILNTANHTVETNGVMITLPPTEYQFLEFLMKHPNQAFTSEALFKRVWPSESTATNEAVKAVVKRLRKKLDPDGRVLTTVHGTGYMIRNN